MVYAYFFFSNIRSSPPHHSFPPPLEVASTFVPVLERCSVLLAELDVITSFAHVAAYSSKGYCRPEMTDGEEDGLGIEVSILFSSISNCD